MQSFAVAAQDCALYSPDTMRVVLLRALRQLGAAP